MLEFLAGLCKSLAGLAILTLVLLFVGAGLWTVEAFVIIIAWIPLEEWVRSDGKTIEWRVQIHIAPAIALFLIRWYLPLIALLVWAGLFWPRARLDPAFFQNKRANALLRNLCTP